LRLQPSRRCWLYGGIFAGGQWYIFPVMAYMEHDISEEAVGLWYRCGIFEWRPWRGNIYGLSSVNTRTHDSGSRQLRIRVCRLWNTPTIPSFILFQTFEITQISVYFALIQCRNELHFARIVIILALLFSNKYILCNCTNAEYEFINKAYEITSQKEYVTISTFRLDATVSNFNFRRYY